MANTIAISADTTGFVSGVNRAESAMRGLGRNIQTATAPGMFGGLTQGLQGLLGGLSIMATLTAAARGFYAAMEQGGTLVDLSAQTGVAVDRLMVLRTAFEQAGIGADSVQPVIAKLQKSIAEAATGNADAAAKFRMLGVAIKDIQGLSAEDQLQAVGEAINKIQNPAQRAALSMEIFGKSGAKMLALFAAGGMNDAAENVGNQAQLMLENAGLFDRATDVLGTAGSKMQGLFVGVAAQVVPQIIEVVDSLNSIDLSGIGQAFGNAISFWINYFRNFGAEGRIIYNTLAVAFKDSVNGLNESLQMVWAQTAAGLKLAFGEAVNMLNESLQKDFNQTFAGMKLLFADVANMLNESLQSTWNQTYSGLKLAFASAINYLATELEVLFSATAAKTKALFKGENAEAAAKKAREEVLAKGQIFDVDKLQKQFEESKSQKIEPLFDSEKLKKDLEMSKYLVIEPLFDSDKLRKDLDMSNYKVVAPLLDTSSNLSELEQDTAKIEESKAKAEKTAREKYATPPPAPTGASYIPKMVEEKPVGLAVSSMAKIGGDILGPQTTALDISRQQLVAQQQTAQNTARMVDKLNKLNTGAGAIMGATYQ